MSAVNRQRAIYFRGAAGLKPAIPVDVQDLTRRAQAALSPEAWAYVAGGAGREHTMSDNSADFNRWRIVPRMLRNVEMRDTSIEIFGRRWPSPFFLTPIGALELVHREADLAVARAAAATSTPYMFSNQASVKMEACASVMGETPRFFQLYWSRSDELVASLLQRAENCGCSAIVLTLDTTLLGWRVRDLELGSLPFLKGMGLAQYTSDPVFQRLLDEPDLAPNDKPLITFSAIRTLLAATRRHPGDFWKNLRSGRGLKAVRKFVQIYSRPNITWTDLPFLRKHTRLPIILKGILHPDDARKALDYGVDGIYVSNHGGRQVDGAISAIQVLPAIAEVVRNKVPILFDSGIRSGADAMKAIALGASAVGIGRTYSYALALGGETGVNNHIANLQADLELNMALAGVKNIEELRASGVLSPQPA